MRVLLEQEIAEVSLMMSTPGATALTVGLGAPKQNLWIHRHRSALQK
jgi:UDP-N-acetyl-D-mannosaminuronic acid transferase (WecB/TagA/CpsF family)